MCHYFEYKSKYNGFQQPTGFKHVITGRRYDKCDKAKSTGYTYDDATQAKGKNGHVIQVGSYS